LIEVFNLKKYFGVTKAVDGVNFTVERGEIFGLLGPNGAGKTTTLRMLATILQPTEGDASINGYSICRDPQQVRRQLGVLAEQTGLYDRLTAEENVRYFASLRRLPESVINHRIAELFPKLGIDKYAHKRAVQLSKGMKQKVAIAIAIIHDPPVMIFDEPTSGLDVIAAREVREFINSCKRSDKSLILSTHIMSEAEKLCDRIAIINGGKIIAMGTFAELQRRSGERELEEIFVKLVLEGEAYGA
jgi:sodium transport system ATP-binding protein